MPQGKSKGRYNFSINKKTGKSIGCEFENGTWCNLLKYKRCKYCIRCDDGSKACEVTAF
jgi:hypothetical protein